MIRLANEKDVNEILRLLDQVNNVHAAGRPDLFIMNSRKYTEDGVKRLLEDSSIRIFVCPNEESSNCDAACHLRGYAICGIVEPLPSVNLVPHKALYVDDICVDEVCRRKHVGTELYQHVRSFAGEIGCYHITLNVWALNPSAQKFYESLGMKPLTTAMEDIL